MPDTPKFTFKGNRPTPEEVAKLAESQPFYDLFPLYMRAVLLPENPTRKAYTAVRGVYLVLGDELAQMMKDGGKLDEKTWRKQFNARLRKLDEADSWLMPPLKPMSLEIASKVLKAMGNSSAFFVDATREFVTKQIGKRPRRGQPASKRHLALKALDGKCAYPVLSLRDFTELLCPCGKAKHSPQCKEQLRQQIKALVKFLKSHGFDFTWERIGTPGWTERA
jgi:hypothetical protein